MANMGLVVFSFCPFPSAVCLLPSAIGEQKQISRQILGTISSWRLPFSRAIHYFVPVILDKSKNCFLEELLRTRCQMDCGTVSRGLDLHQRCPKGLKSSHIQHSLDGLPPFIYLDFRGTCPNRHNRRRDWSFLERHTKAFQSFSPRRFHYLLWGSAH